jgi:hypothetical protein
MRTMLSSWAAAMEIAMKKSAINRKGKVRIHPDNWTLPDISKSLDDTFDKVRAEYEKTQAKIESAWERLFDQIEIAAFKQVGGFFEYMQRDAIISIKGTGTITVLFPIETMDGYKWEIDLERLVEQFILETSSDGSRALQVMLRDKLAYLAALLDEFVAREGGK